MRTRHTAVALVVQLVLVVQRALLEMEGVSLSVEMTPTHCLPPLNLNPTSRSRWWWCWILHCLTRNQTNSTTVSTGCVFACVTSRVQTRDVPVHFG